MENSGLVLVEKKNHKKRNILILLCVLIVVIGTGIYFATTEFSVRKIEVKGITTYTEAEVIRAMKEQDYVPNTLVMMAQNQIFGQTYLPFVEEVNMSYEDPHVLRVRVKEKMRAGVFEYMDKNVYFNEDGIAMESRKQRFEGVPVVTGVKFEKLVLGEKIPVKGDYFQTIVSITKKIAAYDLPISEIHFEGENDITLMSGDYEIYLGSTTSLDGKMSRITEVLKAVSSEGEKGTIDMHLYTDEKNIITYRK